MNARCRAPAAALAALLTAAALASPGRAAERACPAPSIETDSAFAALFPELLERIRSELATRPDLDPCARVELQAIDRDTVLVSVTLPDGRTATRSAARDDVLPTLEALLLVPQPSPSPSPTTTAPPAAPRAQPGSFRRVALGSGPRDRDEASSAVEPRSFGIELSLLGGPRMGEGQLAVGLGALSLLEAHGWLFGFASRTDRYQNPIGSDPEMALELGVLAGKRLQFRSFALDFVAGPSVAMKGLAFSETEVARVDGQSPQPRPQPPPLPVDEPSTGPVPRLLLGAHAGFSPRAVLRSFVGMEASIGPARADENPNPASARFPVFALGLVLGGTVGTR